MEEESRGRVSTNNCPLDQKLHIQGFQSARPSSRAFPSPPALGHATTTGRHHARKKRNEDAMDVLMTTTQFQLIYKQTT
jgi:hypothetical protein